MKQKVRGHAFRLVGLILEMCIRDSPTPCPEGNCQLTGRRGRRSLPLHKTKCGRLLTGEGMIYLHANPVAFTNLFLLDSLGYTHRAPAQGDTASGVHAALELPERTLDVDTGRVVDTVADI